LLPPATAEPDEDCCNDGSFTGHAAWVQTHYPGVGDDEVDNFWAVISDGISKPKDNQKELIF
jgi:hypothetical protein